MGTASSLRPSSRSTTEEKNSDAALQQQGGADYLAGLGIVEEAGLDMTAKYYAAAYIQKLCITTLGIGAGLLLLNKEQQAEVGGRPPVGVGGRGRPVPSLVSALSLASHLRRPNALNRSTTSWICSPTVWMGVTWRSEFTVQEQARHPDNAPRGDKLRFKAAADYDPLQEAAKLFDSSGRVNILLRRAAPHPDKQGYKSIMGCSVQAIRALRGALDAATQDVKTSAAAAATCRCNVPRRIGTVSTRKPHRLSLVNERFSPSQRFSPKFQNAGTESVC